VALHNLSSLQNRLRFAFNDVTKQIHAIRVTSEGEEDLGAVNALCAPATVVLSFSIITITATSATLASLVSIHTATKKISLKAAGAFSLAVGKDATMGNVTLDANVLYEFGCTTDTDLRIVAGGNIDCLVVQEG